MESLNFQTNLDTRTLADAAMVFAQRNQIAALKTMSGLIRTIIEDWLSNNGGNKIKTLDEALIVLDRLGLTPKRSGTMANRGVYNMSAEEAQEHNEILADIKANNLRILENNTKTPKLAQDRLAATLAFLNKATEADIKAAREELLRDRNV